MQRPFNYRSRRPASVTGHLKRLFHCVCDLCMPATGSPRAAGDAQWHRPSCSSGSLGRQVMRERPGTTPPSGQPPVVVGLHRRRPRSPARCRAGRGRGESALPRSARLLAARAARFVNMLVAACLNVARAASEVSSATGQEPEPRRVPSRSEGKPSEPRPCPARHLARNDAGARVPTRESQP